MVLPAAAAPGIEPESAAGVRTLAERARTDFGAALGLAVGAARPGPDGRSVVAIALSDGQHVEQIEHMLGGGPTLALSRAAKTAVDLVRRTLASRNATS
jgi:nicotinamide mononucleotide (NMN) deamidase PncC